VNAKTSKLMMLSVLKMVFLTKMSALVLGSGTTRPGSKTLGVSEATKCPMTALPARSPRKLCANQRGALGVKAGTLRAANALLGLSALGKISNAKKVRNTTAWIVNALRRSKEGAKKVAKNKAPMARKVANKAPTARKVAKKAPMARKVAKKAAKASKMARKRAIRKEPRTDH